MSIDPSASVPSHRKPIPSQWEVYRPSHELAELFHGTGDFRLSRRDIEIFERLFHYNFALGRRLPIPGTRQNRSKRLGKLLLEGLIARLSIPRFEEGGARGREYAYCLTAFGFECLVATGHRIAIERAAIWKPAYITFSTRNNIFHELAVSELCFGVIEYLLDLQISAGWKSSRFTVQKANPMVAGGQSLIIAPDAAIAADNGHSILVEYEESLRPEAFGDRLSNYRRYFQHRLWESDYLKPPKLLISASATADRQRYWENPYSQALRMAQEVVPLYQYVYLIQEQLWRRGQWLVQSISPGSELVPLKILVMDPRFRR